jgi:hypothetical protein
MFDIQQNLFDDDGCLDDDRVGDYIEGLTKAFENSPEGKAFYDQADDGGYASMMLEYAITYPGVTPPEMSLADFHEVVFELFPRKVSTSAESAPVIVAELRAFWTFLHRQYGLANAPRILAALTNSAVERLARELANPANFGMAKSFIMQGMQAGYDMTTQEGLDAFMAAYNSKLRETGPAPPDFRILPPPIAYDEDFPSPLTPKQRAEKRKKRKAQRKAKKRNRK